MKIELSDDEAILLANILKVYLALKYISDNEKEQSTISTVLGQIDSALEQEKE